MAVLVIASAVVLTYPGKTAESGKMRVVASFYPLYYFSSEIGKDRVDASMLIPDNAEPHAWDPTPSDLMKVIGAKVVVYNGQSFEPWMQNFLAQVDQSKMQVVDTSVGVDFLLSDTVIWPYEQAVRLLSNGPNLTVMTSLTKETATMVEASPSTLNIQIDGSGLNHSGYLRLNLTAPDDFRFFVTDPVQFEILYQNGTAITPELVIGHEDRYPAFDNAKFIGLEDQPEGVYYIHMTSATDRTKMVIVQGSGEVGSAGGEPHEHGLNDPHFWIDPVSAKVQVDNILSAFKIADPGNATYYQANANALKARLDNMDQNFTVGLQNRTKNAIITTHEGFNYLAQRYHFSAYGAIGISGDQQPSAQDLANLAQKVEELGLHYVYSEPIFSDSVINTIASETGATVLILDGAHGRTGTHAGMDYFQIMEANLQSLATGLEVIS